MTESGERADSDRQGSQRGRGQRAGLNLRHELLYNLHLHSLVMLMCVFLNIRPAWRAPLLGSLLVGEQWRQEERKGTRHGTLMAIIAALSAILITSSTCWDLPLVFFFGPAPGYVFTLLLIYFAHRGRISWRVEAACLAVLAASVAASAIITASEVVRDGGLKDVLALLLASYIMLPGTTMAIGAVSMAAAASCTWLLVAIPIWVTGLGMRDREANAKVVLAALLVLCVMSIDATVRVFIEKSASVEEHEQPGPGSSEQ